MKNKDPLDNPELDRASLFVLMIPVIGFFPALWNLYRRQGSPERKAVSRLAIALAFSWLLGHILLEAGAISAESSTLTMLLMSSLLTTSYFIVALGLMVRLWKRQPLWLPGISRVAEQVVGKHLS
ncbi:MAG: hypothetical protein JGK24_24575 [Microcoleus sp. PH2017_29_MFU_D_A]|jgi:hypothetical protein|uniref:hypothetical protein n=1 Tax=unclassified Microcoleus TaxID=2642155 RepID=UPI001D6CDA75|nr:MULTISPECIES: hypothetical protein [unclassified Microcoleus]MCC3419567.1 hypothetical protein [Microcoleus sp. PH2017_07_MST_O_A]MCC3428820.1 hypothetical protein [Microcoleus sp. PH2017_04_SCI_O_A]MCC3443637.1 hypothetical protein [Microcoleus sp. PH2017_03_ELD_O_A]MCC3469682.1 hypothetical protein [Microcoleus sp. PH2017_06_SFM_O_A]MCC3505474.1 hypothetical protein [Microcoleus sp. PH2017_19_SFW_U_A]MCC3510706.1 hypothetical protein [Microcoleus sp. PH2017_17_BER_D_A]TAE10114.1 MAG: hy